MDQPNPISVAWGIANVLLTIRKPRPTGDAGLDHTPLQPVLDALNERGIPGIQDHRERLEVYISTLTLVDPDRLMRDSALAYWLNLYNAGAMLLAANALKHGESSVLRIPGGFRRPIVGVAGEELSLDAIEHAKIRRFRDPRIHGALVCGSLSCPSLRPSPYTGRSLDAQLDDQMRSFMAGGGAVAGAGSIRLSRIFLWYGGDFVNPESMPTFLPVSKKKTLAAVSGWLPSPLAGETNVEFQPYDWGLACNVG